MFLEKEAYSYMQLAKPDTNLDSMNAHLYSDIGVAVTKHQSFLNIHVHVILSTTD